MSKSRLIVATACVLAGALGVGVVQARTADVQWSVVIGSPVYTQPVAVHTRPMPVHVQPVPLRARPPAVYPRNAYARPTRWDRDGDGIPNRHDRLYNPRWDRDGDGIANRHDRHDGRGWQGR
jgi:hypothetical protein